MKTRLFLQRIEKLRLELLDAGVNPVHDWRIDVLNDEFEAYDMPITELVYCLDTISLFPILRQYNDIDADDDYYYWAENPVNGYVYALDQETDEIVLVDSVTGEVVLKCISNQHEFLEVLYKTAEYYKFRLMDSRVEESLEDWINELTRLAGGAVYREFCTHLLG